MTFSLKLCSSQNTLITTILPILLLLLLLLLSSPLSSSSPTTTKTPPPSRPFKKIYAFGDSFTDTGNTASSSGPNGFRFVSNPPYGMTYFHHPTNRYSDGRLVIDFITQALSLPFLPPYLNKGPKPANKNFSYGVNFAIAGSTAINHAFFVKNNLSLDITPESIQTQLLWFSNFLEKECKSSSGVLECSKVFEDALIWVGEIGVNDYAYTIGSTVSYDTIQELSIKSVTGFLQAMLKLGAKYVVVQGLPPTGCLPLAMTLSPEDDRDELGCVGSVNKQNNRHNVILQAKIHDLRVQFPHSVIAYADFWNVYHTVMKNPKKYGFTEPFKACCGSGGDPYNFDIFAACGSPNVTACSNPSQHINWDGVHLTEGMYKVVFDMILHGNSCHPSFDYLLNRRKQHSG